MRTRALLPAVLAAAALFTTAACGSETGSGGDGDAGQGQPQTSSSAPSTAAPAEGEGVPEALNFTATTLDGEPFDGTTLAGKPTVLWFWAPWCPTCRGQAAETAKVAADFEGKANVVGVAGLDKEDAMKEFVADTGTGDFTHLSDEAGDVWKRFEITQQSVYVILDKDGEQVFEGGLPAGKGLADRVAALTG
ncbi:redoxin domain-containing protein [Streptomyces sp. NPDC002845]